MNTAGHPAYHIVSCVLSNIEAPPLRLSHWPLLYRCIDPGSRVITNSRADEILMLQKEELVMLEEILYLYVNFPIRRRQDWD